MKRIVIFLALIFLLTACNNDGLTESESNSVIDDGSAPVGGDILNSIPHGNIGAALEGYNADFESCKVKAYPNLNWENTQKIVPAAIESCHNIKLYPGAGYESRPKYGEIPERYLKKFEEFCNGFFGECDPDYVLFETYDADILGEDITINGVNYAGHPKASDHSDLFESGDIYLNYFIYRNIEKKQYLWWVCANTDYPHWYNKGESLKLLNDSSIRFSSWLPADMGKPLARYYNDGTHNDKKYMLSDGEVSVGEAIDYFTNYYYDALPFDNNQKPQYSVRYVDVYKMTDDVYGYLIGFTHTWNSISFEFMGERYSYENEFSPYSIDGQALMIKKNDIDTAIHFDPFSPDEEVGEPITNILSLSEAADIVSNSLSEKVMFNVNSAELIYHGNQDNNEILLKPTWKLDLYNTNDNYYYATYVDAASGDFKYYAYTPI